MTAAHDHRPDIPRSEEHRCRAIRSGWDCCAGSRRWKLSTEDTAAQAPRSYEGNDVLTPWAEAKGALRFDGRGGNDVISAGGGALDRVLGSAGADVFLFAAKTKDGLRDRTWIDDFGIGTDAIDLGGAEFVYDKSHFGSLILTLDGDGDQIILTGIAHYDDWLFL
ncbi:M10 family metallopeptidase C-terminal domain-containing protein [Chelativorans alearense]|uniref:M10 family metallopeptidase C-terminal domain-containing protein n=1 Tax=Chelativorans alearense TaxID=2681495 RepID=UPI001969D6EA|nr:hypothetical protein [Chelativorans alearense]